MVPPLQFDGWEWVGARARGAGRPLVRLAASTARPCSTRDTARATMDTLISLGTLAALVWSAIVLVAGLDAHTYFEVGCGDHRR